MSPPKQRLLDAVQEASERWEQARDLRFDLVRKMLAAKQGGCTLRAIATAADLSAGTVHAQLRLALRIEI